MSRNSTETADAVRRGELEAGLVALPVDERGLVVGERVWTTEAVYVTADRARLRGEPRSIQQVAAAQLVLPEVLAGDEDPTRRQLRERAADAGVRLEPVVEVESPAAALDLVVRGVGDSVASRSLIGELGLEDRLAWVSLDPPLWERYAFITPRGARRGARDGRAVEHRRAAPRARPGIGKACSERRESAMDGGLRALHSGLHG